MIVLVGFMGAGKTTTGQLLAARLGVAFLDSDHVIEARAGRPIPEIFATDGEAAFRALEHEVIADLLAGPPVVLALGGGAASHEQTRKLLASLPVAFLRVSFAEALARVGGDGYRPMLARPDIAEVYEGRQASYAEVATVTIDVDGRSPAEIAEDVLAQLGVTEANEPSEPAAPASRRPASEPGSPQQSREDTDFAWGELPEPDDDRLYRDRPPHWDDF